MNLRTTLSQIWTNIQYTLFDLVAEETGPLTAQHKKLISILELIKIEYFISSYCPGNRGRPPKDRVALGRAFVAKIVFKLEFTSQLRDYLLSDKQLRVMWMGIHSSSTQRVEIFKSFCRICFFKIAREDSLSTN